MQFWTSIVAVLLSCTVMASSPRAHDMRMAEQAAPAEASAAVPLYDDLGNLTYSVTTSSPLAQRYFDQGLRLTMPLIMRKLCVPSARPSGRIQTAPCATGVRPLCLVPTLTPPWTKLQGVQP